MNVASKYSFRTPKHRPNLPDWGSQHKLSDKEWIAAGHHLGAFDYRNGCDKVLEEPPKKLILDWNGPAAQSIPERGLWEAFFQQLIADIRGDPVLVTVKGHNIWQPASEALCDDCHESAGCDCFRKGRRRKKASRCPFELSRLHTIQKCAMEWLDSERAREICEMLGLEIGYLKRMVWL